MLPCFHHAHACIASEIGAVAQWPKLQTNHAVFNAIFGGKSAEWRSGPLQVACQSALCGPQAIPNSESNIIS